MSRKFEKFNKRRLRSSYFGVVFSISLVLLLLGIFAVLLFNADNLSRSVRENFTITLLIKPEASEMNVRQFQKTLAMHPGIKEVEFISKEEAAEMLMKDLDEDFLAYLGTNPLTDAIDIRLNADYVEEKMLADLQEEVLQDEVVQEVIIDEDLAKLMYENLHRIALIMLLAAFGLLLVSFALINNSIQLAVYSRRFLIKTMQLVGATRRFIRKPFLRAGTIHGLIGGLLASAIIVLAFYYLNWWIPELGLEQQWVFVVILSVALCLSGMIISGICTYFAVRKFLNLKTDDLYY